MKTYFYENGNRQYCMSYVEEGEQIDRLSYGMINNNSIPGTMPYGYSEYNGYPYFYYDVTDKMTLTDYMQTVSDKKKGIELLMNFCNMVLQWRDYLLSPENFVWGDSDKIFINCETLMPEMLCKGVVSGEAAAVDLHTFLYNLFYSLPCFYEGADSVREYLSYTTRFSVEDFKQVLSREKANQETREADAYLLSMSEMETTVLVADEFTVKKAKKAKKQKPKFLSHKEPKKASQVSNLPELPQLPKLA